MRMSMSEECAISHDVSRYAPCAVFMNRIIRPVPVGAATRGNRESERAGGRSVVNRAQHTTSPEAERALTSALTGRAYSTNRLADRRTLSVMTIRD